jgi:hypothetical protein
LARMLLENNDTTIKKMNFISDSKVESIYVFL